MSTDQTSACPTPISGCVNLECVELYIPKKLEHLSELYKFLERKLAQRNIDHRNSVPINGFSLYEVDGAFQGERVYQERTLVVRILFMRAPDDTSQSIQDKILNLGREIARTVALTEEELWICHYPQGVVILRPQDR